MQHRTAPSNVSSIQRSNYGNSQQEVETHILMLHTYSQQSRHCVIFCFWYTHSKMLQKPLISFIKPVCLYGTTWKQLFQITNLMHNSFIFQQYICYTMFLNMFPAARCSKHVEERSVTYILLKNKRIVQYVGDLKKSIL